MVSVAKLIHEASVSYLPTKFPVHYYGLPDGKVYLIFARFYNKGFGKSGIEFVFAQHKEFLFDYKNETVLPATNDFKRTKLFNESVDKPNPKIKIYKIYKKLNSFAEAKAKLNEEAKKIPVIKKKNKVVKITPLLKIKRRTVTA